MGILKPETKRYVLVQIEQLRSRGAQGIVLGCTEFPLIVKQNDLTFPVSDTTNLHSKPAVDFILGRYTPRAALSAGYFEVYVIHIGVTRTNSPSACSPRT